MGKRIEQRTSASRARAPLRMRSVVFPFFPGIPGKAASERIAREWRANAHQTRPHIQGVPDPFSNLNNF